jgi:biopolymer transport protein TolR
MAFGAGGGSPDEVKGDINVTPLVDVCLVLLIIFMVVTPMLQPGVDVLLPEGPHAEKKPGKEGDLIVSIKPDGTVFVGQDWIPDRNLTTYLTAEHQKDPNRFVMLKADRRINYGKVRLVMKAANEANFTQVAILTQNQQAGARIAQHGMND